MVDEVAIGERFRALAGELAHLIFARAIERNEIPADTDIEAALDLLSGPFYHRLLHAHAALTDRFARTVVAYVVAGVSTARSS